MITSFNMMNQFLIESIEHYQSMYLWIGAYHSVEQYTSFSHITDYFYGIVYYHINQLLSRCNAYTYPKNILILMIDPQCDKYRVDDIKNLFNKIKSKHTKKMEWKWIDELSLQCGGDPIKPCRIDFKLCNVALPTSYTDHMYDCVHMNENGQYDQNNVSIDYSQYVPLFPQWKTFHRILEEYIRYNTNNKLYIINTAQNYGNDGMTHGLCVYNLHYEYFGELGYIIKDLINRCHANQIYMATPTNQILRFNELKFTVSL